MRSQLHENAQFDQRALMRWEEEGGFIRVRQAQLAPAADASRIKMDKIGGRIVPYTPRLHAERRLVKQG